jgi:hypothetical protein
LIDRASLRLKQIEEGCGVPLGYHECMQFRHRVFVTHGKRKSIKGDDTLLWNFTENATY